MEIGYHTDAFNSSYWSFKQCLEWGRRNGLHWIECGTIDGVSWIHGLGYQPHVALWEDPLALRRTIEQYEIRFSQLDAAFPLSRPEGATLGVSTSCIRCGGRTSSGVRVSTLPMTGSLRRA